jgi:acyl-CoA synthetase (AMP-forming)/AMP-acid ligase II
MDARKLNISLWVEPLLTQGFQTGDEASMSSDGYITITGRIKDLIIRGGENIHPLEIENCLLANTDVADVSVVGIPDSRYGEAVAAFVIARDHSMNKVTAEGIQKWVRDQLSNHLGKLTSRYISTIDDFTKLTWHAGVSQSRNMSFSWVL